MGYAIHLLGENDEGITTFLYTTSLSQLALSGPSKGTPNILILYLKDLINSTDCFNTINSDPHVDIYTEF